MQKALTPEQVADFLQLSKTTVYRKIKTGEIPAKRIGKEFRIASVYLYYFETGMDYDIAQKESLDAKIIKENEDLLKSVRIENSL